jgi:hypothetical protein
MVDDQESPTASTILRARFLAPPRRKSRHSREACPREGGERESTLFCTSVDPRLRGGDERLTFISMGTP